MTYGSLTDDDFDDEIYDPPRRPAVLQHIVAGAGLGCIALTAGWFLYANLSITEFEGGTTVLTKSLSMPAGASAAARVAAGPQGRLSAADPAAVLLAALPDRFLHGAPTDADIFSPVSPIAPAQLVLDAPPPQAPPVRTARAGRTPPPMRIAQQTPPAAPDQPGIFRKLGNTDSPKTVLAYAGPDGGVFGNGDSLTPGRSPTPDARTAVYDISARTVYLPDGTKLEAHSGLGPMMDDPRHVHVRMRGPTPPSIYNLVMREAPFHGVRAIRLVPVGGNPYGRTGLLAHTYMLGPTGASNGCVSFKNYEAFLQAYLNGKIDRLIVVARRET